MIWAPRKNQIQQLRELEFDARMLEHEIKKNVIKIVGVTTAWGSPIFRTMQIESERQVLFLNWCDKPWLPNVIQIKAIWQLGFSKMTLHYSDGSCCTYGNDIEPKYYHGFAGHPQMPGEPLQNFRMR